MLTADEPDGSAMRDTREVRATGLRGDAPPEIIEIIDDDTNAFGDRASTHPVYDTVGPRWIGPVAAAALVGLIGYGVATSASTSGLTKTAPATSTSVEAQATTLPATTTTVAAPLVPYYSASPPPDFSVQFADIQSIDGGNFFSPGSYGVWAIEGSTAGTGSWFSITAYPAVPQSTYQMDAYRVQTDLQSIAIAHMPSGHSIAQFSQAGKAAVTLTTFGWSDEDLIQLADSITVDHDKVQFSDPSLVVGYRWLSSVPPWLAIEGTPVEQIYYAHADDPNGGFGITVAPRPTPSEGGATLDRQIALRFFLDHSTQFGVDGHSAVAGTVVGQPDYSMASWIAGTHIVTISGLMPLAQLIAIARTVRQVSSDTWRAMQFQASSHSNDPNGGPYDETTSVPVSFGTDAAGDTWTIQVAVATFSTQQQINWQWGQSGFGSSTDGTAKINTVVDNTRTYVLADLPRAIAAHAELHVDRTGLDPIVVPFNDIDPNVDRTFAAYAFSEPVQYTAQIVGSDGTVLASWPSS